MHFYDRPLERLDGIDDRDRGKGISCRIDDDGVRALPRRLDPVDQLALVVRLVKRERKPELLGVLLAALPDLRQRGGAVNMRLAHALSSSPRTRGPIITVASWSSRRQPPSLNARPRRMGPRFRGDDIEVYHLDCASLHPGYAHYAPSVARAMVGGPPKEKDSP